MADNAEPTARQWIVDAITDVFGQTENLHNPLLTAAQEAVLYDMGTPAPGRDEYEAMLRSGERRDEYVQAVGYGVRDQVREMVGAALDEREIGEGDMLRLLLITLLDLEDSTQAFMLGQQYLPDRAEDIEWPESTEDS